MQAELERMKVELRGMRGNSSTMQGDIQQLKKKFIRLVAVGDIRV